MKKKQQKIITFLARLSVAAIAISAIVLANRYIAGNGPMSFSEIVIISILICIMQEQKDK